ncbi:DNA ligase [Plodia interpunctella granulovirus]|uniref:DNA ligase n=1 Tax=Plodia interpunctella granulovirus TaxID=262175 RepID=A0A1L5JHH9_9BBAC|nr:DNA ligase [Plodia interpunctella granulovirus]APO13990.1 DNA ligase [Plodia interpunctella granulovirus]
MRCILTRSQNSRTCMISSSMKMLFSEFVKVYNDILHCSTIGEVSAYITNNNVRKEELIWLYSILTFKHNHKINDKHLLTIFCRIHEPHIDRKNLQDAFKTSGVTATCVNVAKVHNNDPTLTMVKLYDFMQRLQKVPTRSYHLIKLFRETISFCDTTTLTCLVDLVRNINKSKKMFIKKRNAYLHKLIFGKKHSDGMDVFVEREGDVPGKPIEPMLAQPCKSFDHITFEEFCVEVKYDGERVQLHKYNNRLFCYKRNLNINSKLQEIVEIFERELAHVNSVILDCELIGHDLATYQLIAFDVLHLNGRCLLDEKLRDRKMELEAILPTSGSRIMSIEYVLSTDRECVRNWVENIVHNVAYVEGVVVKNWNGTYEQKKKKWFKIKKCYFENVCSADLVVVGGWKTEDKRIIIYLVATPIFYNNKWLFLPVSKVKIAKHNLEPLMEPYNNHDWLITNNHLRSLKKIPNMVARNPFEMPVWEMEGDFIRSENTWTFGELNSNYVSIRLPRFIRVREDKSYLQASSLFDLKLMCSITSNTLEYPELYDLYLRDNLKYGSELQENW